MERKKILILGGEGFVGRNIANFLSHKYVFCSAGPEETIFGKNRSDKFININPYENEIENDYDVIVHLIDNAVSLSDFEGQEKRLIENLKINKKNHLILFSSAVVYANPESDYGKRKIKLEEIYEHYCGQNGIKLTIFRLFNIYGPYHIPNKQGSLVANIFFNYLNEKETEISDMSAKRDFIYSRDMVKFVDHAIENEICGKFDLATAKMTTIGELIEKIENVVGEKLNIRDKGNREDIVCPLAKNDFSKNIKFDSMESGLKETFEFYKENLNIISNIVK